MKRNRFVFVIWLWIIVLFLQGCVDIQMNVGESVIPPENKQVPIQGTWKIEKYYIPKSYKQKDKISWRLGQNAVFSKEAAILGNEICLEPEYKLKNVSAREYFLYAHKVNYRDLKIERGNIDVISISDKDKHFYDFIKLKGNQLIVSIDNIFYFLTKISNAVNKEYLEELMIGGEVSKDNAVSEPELLRSGVLLGLGHPEEDNNDVKNQNKTYRTLWIYVKNKKLYPVMEKRDLFIPRKSGFWVLGIDRKTDEHYMQDYLYAYSLEKSVEKEDMYKKIKELDKNYKGLNKNIFRNILFVGNDYVIVESYDLSKKPGKIQVLPIDNLINKGVKISDIAGEEGKEVFMSSAQSYLSRLNKRETKRLKLPEEDSFKLARRNGHWIMQGRIYHRIPMNEDGYFTFNINMIPPGKLVQYDELQISWGAVKERVPEAIDAYTSPNKDIAVIITSDLIYVYTLERGKLSDKYLKKIKLKPSESIVMAEWAVGSYVERWNDSLNDSTILLENK